MRVLVVEDDKRLVDAIWDAENAHPPRSSRQPLLACGPPPDGGLGLDSPLKWGMIRRG